MANPATTDDIEARWRSLTEAEATVAATLLDDAWWLLTARRPSLEADITAGTVLQANVVRVLANMVKRVMMNPDGKRSESIDDYSYTRDELVSGGLLYVSDVELADLVPSGYKRAKSVRLVAYGDR